MFLSNLTRDPYNDSRLQPCGIGNELPKMSMIRRFKLVFNDDKSVST